MSAQDPLRTPRPTHKRRSSSIASRATIHAYSTAEPVPPMPKFDPSMVASTSASAYASPSPKPASRFMSSVRRSLSVSHGAGKTRSADKGAAGMYSTPEERNVSSRVRQPDFSASPPTVEQIAMGLHLSRTPHLRPAGGPYHSPYGRTSAQGSQHHFEPLYRTTTSPPLPPPPARSSLKKPSTVTSTSSSANPGLSTASSTTITSNTPSTPPSHRSVASLKSRMARFIPGTRSFSAPSSAVASPRASTDFVPQKKEVRFTTAEPRKDIP